MDFWCQEVERQRLPGRLQKLGVVTNLSHHMIEIVEDPPQPFTVGIAGAKFESKARIIFRRHVLQIMQYHQKL